MKKLFFFFSFFTVVLSLHAEVIVVTNANDNTSNVPENSFRAAIAAAESGDTIKFNIVGTDTITMVGTTGISGAGKVLVVDGLNTATSNFIVLKKASNVTTRLFSIATSSGSSGINVTFKNFKFRDIYAEQNGAVFTSGHSSYTTVGDIKIKLENCWFKNCTSSIASSSTGGGGVYYVSHGTELTIHNSLFENNKMQYSDIEGIEIKQSIGGGAISSTGTNTAKLIVVNSTFSGNYSASRGGAIYLGHPMDMINCTVAGNSSGYGGGFYLNTASNVSIINSILTHNYGTANTNRADFYRNSASATINIAYSLVGTTNAELGIGSSTYNSEDILFANYTNNDSIPVLADNGGPTFTIALTQYSIAKNSGTATFAGFDIPDVDQRGVVRNSTPCMGAFEFSASITTKTNTIGGNNKIIVRDRQIILNENAVGTIKVYNISGKEVLRNQTDLSNLPNGIYIVIFTDVIVNDIFTAKVIFQ